MNDVMVARRDRLHDHLRTAGQLVWGVGLTRADGQAEHLLVIAPEGAEIPATFEGVDVTVRITAKAKAQLA